MNRGVKTAEQFKRKYFILIAMQIIPKLSSSWTRCVNTEIFSKASTACTDGAVMWSVS